MAAYELAPPLHHDEPNLIIGPDERVVLRNAVGKPVEISIVTLTNMLNEAYEAGKVSQ